MSATLFLFFARVFCGARAVCVMVYCAPPTEHNKKIGRISDSFASSVDVSPAHFSSTHTLLWSPHPQLILLHLNQSKQPGGGQAAVVLGPSNPSLHHSHLLLMSDKAPQHQWRSTQLCVCVCGEREDGETTTAIQRGFNSSFSGPILVSRVKTQQLRKSCLAGQSKPLSVSFWEIRAWISGINSPSWHRWWCQEKRRRKEEEGGEGGKRQRVYEEREGGDRRWREISGWERRCAERMWGDERQRKLKSSKLGRGEIIGWRSRR